MDDRSSVIKTPTSEILDILFPPSSGSGAMTVPDDDNLLSYVAPDFGQRVEAGREAQGYTPTTDAEAARTLVPSRELTYGEYDLGFFSSLVQECLSIRAGGGMSNPGALEAEAR